MYKKCLSYKVDDFKAHPNYQEDEIDTSGISFATIMGVFLLVVIAVFILAILGIISNQYENELNVDKVNSNYIRLANEVGKANENYVVSGLSYDLSLSELSEDENFSYTQRVALLQQSGRNVDSLKNGESLVKDFAKDEDLKIFETVSNEEISEILGVEYESDVILSDYDRVAVISIADEFALDSCYYEDNLYLSGVYYKCGAAFKVDMADGLHEFIWYRGELPSSKDQWKAIGGTLCVPNTSLVCTSSVSQTVRGLLNEDTYKVAQIASIRITGNTNAGRYISYTNRVGIPYNIAVVSKNTGTVVASGRFIE